MSRIARPGLVALAGLAVAAPLALGASSHKVNMKVTKPCAQQGTRICGAVAPLAPNRSAPPLMVKAAAFWPKVRLPEASRPSLFSST